LIYPVLVLSVIFSFFMYFGVFCAHLLPQTLRYFGMRLMPQLASDDDRRGFELFEDVFTWVCALSAVSLVGITTMVFQNVYLRTDFASPMKYMIPFLKKAVETAGNISDGSKSAYDAAGFIFAADAPGGILQAVGGTLLSIVIILIVIGLSWALLRVSANSARRYILSEVVDGPDKMNEFYGLDDAVIRERAAKMTVWPLSWMSLQIYSITLLSMLVGVAIVRFAIFCVALAVVVLVFRALKRISSYEEPAKGA
jgi:hypothetical protein